MPIISHSFIEVERILKIINIGVLGFRLFEKRMLLLLAEDIINHHPLSARSQEHYLLNLRNLNFFEVKILHLNFQKF